MQSDATGLSRSASNARPRCDFRMRWTTTSATTSSDRDEPVVVALVERDGPNSVGFDSVMPERAVGQEVHLVDEDLDDRAERERDHREIRAGHAQRRQREHRAEQPP